MYVGENFDISPVKTGGAFRTFAGLSVEKHKTNDKASTSTDEKSGVWKRDSRMIIVGSSRNGIFSTSAKIYIKAAYFRGKHLEEFETLFPDGFVDNMPKIGDILVVSPRLCVFADGSLFLRDAPYRKLTEENLGTVRQDLSEATINEFVNGRGTFTHASTRSSYTGIMRRGYISGNGRMVVHATSASKSYLVLKGEFETLLPEGSKEQAIAKDLTGIGGLCVYKMKDLKFSGIVSQFVMNKTKIECNGDMKVSGLYVYNFTSPSVVVSQTRSPEHAITKGHIDYPCVGGSGDDQTETISIRPCAE